MFIIFNDIPVEGLLQMQLFTNIIPFLKNKNQQAFNPWQKPARFTG